MTKSKSDYSIQTVSNALRVLEVFSEEDEIGVSDLSRRLNLHKNNVFRLLATLEENGYIEQSARSEQYRLGTGCLELGRAFARGNTLLRSARPILVELSALLGETVHIATLRKTYVIHLDCEAPDQLIMTASRIGLRLPASCTALGKVLLAGLEPEARGQLLKEMSLQSGFESRSSNSIFHPVLFSQHPFSFSILCFWLFLP